MTISKRQLICSLALMLAMIGATSADAAFNSFVIRQGVSGSPAILPNNDYVPGATEFVIAEGGQKAGLGSSDLDGYQVGDVTQLAITRLDDRTRFAAGSGPYVAPYFNFWITDGLGKYAVIANEPSNPDFQSLYNNGYDLDWSEISGKVAKVYENSDKSWLPNNGVGLTFADLANYTIQAPSVAELTTGWAGLGSGAPRELGTNAAYGFNWVFGDTLSNYVADAEGYVVINAAASAVPEPATIALVSLGAFGCLLSLARRRC
jgi:hypothetical protein